MPEEKIGTENLTPQQSSEILQNLNRISTIEELLKVLDVSDVYDIGKQTAAAILERKKELGAFTHLQQISDIQGIGRKKISLLVQMLNKNLGEPEQLLTPADIDKYTARHVLDFINTAPSATFIARAIEIPRLRDIGIETAKKIFNYRLETGAIKTLHELSNVPGIGPKRFTDIINALKVHPLPRNLLTPDTVPAEDAMMVLTKLNQAGSAQEIDALINIPRGADVGPGLAELIYLTRQELGGFNSLSEIDNISRIGPARFTSIVKSLASLPAEVSPLRSRVVKKATLAQNLKPFLNPEDKSTLVRGTDTVSTSIEKLGKILPYDHADHLMRNFYDAIESKVITSATSVADLVYFPHLASNLKISPPDNIMDPASLPDMSADLKWFRTRGSSYYRFSGPCSIEIITQTGWSEEISVDMPFAVEPVKEGMIIRKVMIEGSGYHLSNLSMGPALAFRITCKGGIKAKLTFQPRNLNYHDTHVAHVPPDWDFPGNEIWINPINDLFPRPTDPPKPHGTLPGRVVIGGSSSSQTGTGNDNGEDKGDSVFIGTQVFTVMKKPLPWPWGPGPWPPWPWGPDPSPRNNGIYIAPPRIFGEEIDNEIIVQVTGCECIRKNETEEYIAHPIPEGGTYKWVVEDDDIAEIQGPDDQKTVELKGLEIGKTALKLKYSKDYYEAEFEMGISVIYQRFTMKDQPRAEILAVPLIQPSPSVRISTIDTQPKIESVNLERHQAKFKIRVEGQLRDALIEITKVKVCAANGFEVELPKEENEKGKFDDNNFLAKEVEITGPGRSYIRVIATNTISFVGTDTAQVVTRLRAADEQNIRRLEAEWARARAEADPGPINDARKLLENAWNDALQNVEVEVGFLTHTDNMVLKAPGEHKWSVSVEDDVKMGQVKLQNGIDGHDLTLEEEEEKLIDPEEDPKNYFLLHYNYGEREELTWEKDGKMLGKAGEPMQLIYLNECCGHDGPIVGVEFEKKPGIQFIKKNESITLEAKGKPESFENIRGLYHWKVAAHPVGAVFKFEPDDATVKQVKFFTDTPGVYTFRVDYELVGATTPWTYALVDAQILFKINAVPRLFRLGQYDGEMAKHLDRPYYGERSHKVQRGAEIMIYNAESGPIGQEMKISVRCPMELTLSDSIKARAFFTDDTHQDYPIYVDSQFRFMAEAEIISAKVIQRLYIIDIQYGNLQRRKGDAVWIDVRVKPLNPPVLEPDEALSDTTAFNSSPSTNGQPEASGHTAPAEVDLEALVKIAIDGGDNIGVTPDDSENIQPRVNLILYNRDLGAALPSQGFDVLSNSGECHNLPNGNLFVPIPVLEAKGHGISTSLSLTYNCLQAILQDSLELLRLMNGVKPSDIEKFYCPNPIGKGWTHSYNCYVRDYIKPGITYANLTFYVEVIAPDGNRIQMKIAGDAAAPGDQGLGDYYPEYQSDHLLGSAEYGHSLMLTKSKNQGKIEYLLTDIHGQEWKFDDRGRLVEVSNLLTRNTNTKPLRLEYGNTFVRIKDSVERETVINFLQGSSDTTLSLTTPDGEVTFLSYNHGLLTDIMLRGGFQSWKFEYETNFLQISYIKTSLLKKIIEPQDVSIDLEFYTGKEFRGVKEEIARDFWGKLGRMQKDSGEEGREHLWRYLPYDEENQKVIYRNPEEVEFAIVFQRENMAVSAKAYVKQEVDDTTGKRKGTPSYEQVLNGDIAGSLDEIPIEKYQYFGKSKLPEKFTDLHNNETSYEYWQIPGREAHILTKVTYPDGVIHESEIDSGNNRIKKSFNPHKGSKGLFTEFKYNAFANMVEKIYPLLDTTAPGDMVKETFVFDPDTGQLTSHTQSDGLVVTYTYYDQGRDTDRTGLCTGKSIKRTKGLSTEIILTWEMSYDKMGNMRSLYEPLFGGSLSLKYKKSELVEEASRQKITTDRGIEESDVIRFSYNNLRQQRSRINNIAGETWEFNNHGEVTDYTNPVGEKTIIKVYKTGEELQVTDATGATAEYVRDELGRITRINYPMPDNRDAAKRSEGYTDVFIYNDQDATITQQRFVVAAPGGAKGALRSEQIIHYEKGKVKSVTESLKPGNQTTKTEFIYNPWGNPAETFIYDNSDLKRKTTIVPDSWGRTIESIETDGGAARSTKIILDVSGRVKKLLLPSVNGAGETSQEIDYDELGRQVQFKDSYGIITKEQQYFDYGNSTDQTPRKAYSILKEQDPSALAGENRLIIKSRTEWNKRGLAESSFLKKDPSLSDSLFTASDITTILNQVNKSENVFDSLGRTVRETNFTGTTKEYQYDALHRVREIKTSKLVRRSDIDFNTFDANNSSHFTTGSEYLQYLYHPNGNVKEIHEHYGSQINEYDKLGRIMKIIDQAFGNSRDTREEITYDAANRPIKRVFKNNRKQEFEYRDSTRTVMITSENALSKVMTETAHDWEGKILSFKYLENLIHSGTALYGTFKRTSIQYQYGNFSKLKLKSYFDNTTDLLGSIGYDYNPADLRTKTKITVKKSSGETFERETRYEYDANYRMTKIAGGGITKDYPFQYNHAGLLKIMGRPNAGGLPGSSPYDNATTYEHDQNGLLIRMVEEKGNHENPIKLSQIDFYYQRSQAESWEGQTPASFNAARVDSLQSNPHTLKQLKYRRFFAEQNNNDLNLFIQDYAYESSGQPVAAVTRHHDSIHQEIYVDARYTEARNAQSQNLTFKNFRAYNIQNFGENFSANFTEEISAVYGYPNLITYRKGMRPAGAPKTDPKNYLSQNIYDADRLLKEQYSLEEDLAISHGPLPHTQPAQIHKFFYHNALGQLMVSVDGIENRSISTNFNPEATATDDQSMQNTAWHQFGPDGAPVFRKLEYYEEPQPGLVTPRSSETFILSDGTCPVVEYNRTEDTLRYFHTVPGLNVRLEATTYLANSLPVGTFYRFDHRGSTLYFTDFYGNVKTDFNYKSHDGQMDLFGLNIKPRVIGSPTYTPAMLVELLSYYVSSGARLDIGMDNAPTLEGECERLQVLGQGQEGIQNPYGFSSGKPYIFLDTALILKTEYGPEGVRIRDASGFLDRFQLGLDAIGLMPIIGEPFDCINGVIHLARGNMKDAALSFMAIVPYLGALATAGKVIGSVAAAGTIAFKAGGVIAAATNMATTLKAVSVIAGSATMMKGAGVLMMGTTLVGTNLSPAKLLSRIKRAKENGEDMTDLMEIVLKNAATMILYIEDKFQKVSRALRKSENHHVYTIYESLKDAEKAAEVEKLRNLFKAAGWENIDARAIDKWNKFALPGHEVCSKYYKMNEAGKTVTEFGHTIHYYQWLNRILDSRNAFKMEGIPLQKVLAETAEQVKEALRKHPALIVADSRDYIIKWGGELGKL